MSLAFLGQENNCFGGVEGRCSGMTDRDLEQWTGELGSDMTVS